MGETNFRESLQAEYIEILTAIRTARRSKNKESSDLKLKTLMDCLKSIEKRMDKLEEHEKREAKPSIGKPNKEEPPKPTIGG